MSRTKITLTCLCISLTACSGGGGSSSSNTQTAQETKLQQLQQQLEKSEKEKATTNDQLTAAQNKIKIALENLAKLQTEKDTTAAQLTAAQNKVKTALENLAKLQTEKDATEAKLATVKEVRNVINQKLDELSSSGQLTHSLTRNSEDPTQYYILIQKDLSSTPLENGFYKYPVVAITPTSNDGILAGDDYIYKQSFSTVYARNWLVGSNYDEKFKRGGSFRVSYITGNPTIQIPSEGSATYTGKAFNADNRGNFEYNVNFATRQGSGRIYALDNNLPEIYLDKNTGENTMVQGRVLNQETVMKITSSASINNKQVGQYTLGFFGDNAQDIAGEVYIDQELPNAVRTNGDTQDRYEGKVRGVVFAVAGTKE